MTTLAAGASTTVTLTAGQSLLILPGGAGVAVLSGGQQAGVSYALGPTRVTIGPFVGSQAVSLSASAPVEYWTQPLAAADEPPLLPLYQSQETFALVSGNGPALSPSIMRSSGLPFVMPSSGNITSTAGALSVTTGFDYVIGPSYSYFPAAALFVGSPAGWYYTNWTSATVGTVFANTYTSGTPEIPASPTALVTVVGAYTQATGFDVIGPNYVVPGGFMGPNGMIEWGRAINNNNSAGNKINNTYFGGTLFQGITQTTNPREAGMGTLRNRGRESAQIGVNAAHGDSGNASALPRLAIDTTVNQVVSMTIQLAVATDYSIIEGHHFRITRSI